MIKKSFGLLALLLIFSQNSFAQQQEFQISWLKKIEEKVSETRSIYQLNCNPCAFPEGATAPPNYVTQLEGYSSASIADIRAEVVPADQLSGLSYLDQLPTSFQMRQQAGLVRKKLQLSLEINTLRRNSATGQVERLLGFSITPESSQIPAELRSAARPRIANAPSVLATGDWYKIGIPATGIYRIDAAFLNGLGINTATLDPRRIRIFGNGGGMLPEANATFRYDDLVENAILVAGEADGSLDAGDYVLFFAEGPHQWKLNAGSYSHATNLYADTNYYFITIGPVNGKRISTQSTPPAANQQSNSYDLLIQYEQELKNLISSGRVWYGETFDLTTSFNFNFNLPNLINSSPVSLKVAAAARSLGVGSTFSVRANGATALTLPVLSTSTYYLDFYAHTTEATTLLNLPGSNLDLNIVYNKPNTFSLGFLDYIWIQGRANLTLNGMGNQLYFFDKNSIGNGNVTTFTIGGLAGDAQLWDVTDPVNAEAMLLNGGTFTRQTDSLKRFIAFNGSSFAAPLPLGRIDNQNLHGISRADMVIVAHPRFFGQAQNLASYRSQRDNMTVVVVTPQQCYNEWSSGRQDITAIRSFVKHLYDKAAPGQEPRYLLLFGDASYDFKYRIGGNTNLVPIFQSPVSTDPLRSYASDSYFGMLDDNEGAFLVNGSDRMDIGIGRFPVTTEAQAEGIVAKIKRYEATAAHGDWRNIIGFLADDEDGNRHLLDAEINTIHVENRYPLGIVRKYYFDAYRQESRPGGTRYPELNRDVNARINKGMLILNYTGHGGVNGLAEERIMTIPEVQAWSNANQLMLLVTATCEFARFDDPGFLSAGEWALLNANGGAIALFSTTRVTFTDGNSALTGNIYRDQLFKRSSGSYPRLGDVMLNAANPLISGVNARSFSLLGDPSLRLAYPEEQANLTHINNVAVSAVPDTIRALAKITISGNVTDRQGNLLSSYQGTLYPTVLDKISSITTLVNDPGSLAYNFKEYRNIIYKGAASVKNGLWSFSFIVPRDIAYNYGLGRISLYATNLQLDAGGDFRNVIVGGTDTNFVVDEDGPMLRLYMNDRSFVNGGLTNKSPNFIAELMDSSGINTVGSGIGRDITLVKNNEVNRPIILNEFYQAALDDYTRGEITYPFQDLEAGNYQLNMKVWDVFNNASDGSLDFIVADDAGLAIKNLLNYPNPFTTRTTFHFDHNRPNEQLEALLQVYTVSGKLVKTLRQNIITQGFHADQLVWDGLDDFGDRIGRGVYIYRLKVQTSSGERAIETQKLVILR